MSKRRTSRAIAMRLLIPLLAASATAAGATTLIRADLDTLVAGHDTVLIGEVVDSYSYWNADGTFILTDHQIVPAEILKGDPKTRELTVTLMGGSVGDLTTLIVGGAVLAPGQSYLLFLNPEDLPGARGALTIREHAQGVFEIRSGEGGLRAVSQAASHPLLPDASGGSQPPGSRQGLLLEDLLGSIRTLTGRGAHGEVK